MPAAVKKLATSRGVAVAKADISWVPEKPLDAVNKKIAVGGRKTEPRKGSGFADT
jgi:hypothetical protein